MGFREFITNRLYRQRLGDELDRYQNIAPPPNPSRRYIDKLVRRLLDPRAAWDARKELSMIGAAAVPSLAAALGDRRFHATKRVDPRIPAPFEALLELLVPHGPEHVLAATLPLVSTGSQELRRDVALHVASLGRADTVPLLARLLEDADGYVRSYVRMGVDRALTAGRADAGFRRQMYDLLLAQCDQDWTGTLNDAPETVVKLDPTRAAVDFASLRWLSASNPVAHEVLKACNAAGILLPEAPTRALFEHALPRAVGDRCYPNQYVAAAALEALVLRSGEDARPLLERAMTSDQSQVREAAAKGVARLAGLHDPLQFVFAREREVGFDELTGPQRVAWCAFYFDAEVSNGGLAQFFGNSSGDRAAETLDALRELGHPEAVAALAGAMKAIGPLARERDRDMRLTAFEGRFDQLTATFEPLESAYYRTAGRLRTMLLLYAARHPEHFRPPPPPPRPDADGPTDV